MQTGVLTVTGYGKTEIPLRGWPRDVIVCFKPLPDPVPCDHEHHDHDHDDDDQSHHGHRGHHTHHGQRGHHSHQSHHNDSLFYKIRHEDVKRGHFGNKYCERNFFLEITWKVSSIREINWFVVY